MPTASPEVIGLAGSCSAAGQFSAVMRALGRPVAERPSAPETRADNHHRSASPMSRQTSGAANPGALMSGGVFKRLGFKGRTGADVHRGGATAVLSAHHLDLPYSLS